MGRAMQMHEAADVRQQQIHECIRELDQQQLYY
jgi:hypothetical protein